MKTWIYAKRFLIGITIGILLSASLSYAYRLGKPQKITAFDDSNLVKLNETLEELWNLSNGRFSLNLVTTDPDGNTNGSAGSMLLYNNSGSFTVKANTDGAKDWINLGSSGSGAPTDATYITQTTNGTLTNEQALSSLASGFMKVTTGTGVISSDTNTYVTAEVDTLDTVCDRGATTNNNITIQKTDGGIILDELTVTDTDFWIANISDSAGDNDDIFQIGLGTTIGSNMIFSINPTSDQAQGFYANNISMGLNALNSTVAGKNNVAISEGALKSDTTGAQNIAIGLSTLTVTTDGNNNTAIGRDALSKNVSGDYNIAIGTNALRDNLNSNYNIAIGNVSLQAMSSGEYNTAIGTATLASNTTGSYNVAIGYYAGQQETGSNKLYIDNSDTTTPLIYGDFSTNVVTIYNDIKANGTITGSIVSFEGGTYDTYLTATSATSTVNYIMPVNAGTLGQVLTTNGVNSSTQLSWGNMCKIGTFTKDITETDRDTSYTGVGFKPSNILFIFTVAAGIDGNGMDNGTNHYCSWTTGAGPNNSSSYSIDFFQIAGTTQTGLIKTFDNDGFTITWDKTGSPTGTGTVFYIAFR